MGDDDGHVAMKEPLSRRDLLRRGLVAAGSMATGGALAGCSSRPAAGRHAPASTTTSSLQRRQPRSYRWPAPVARRRPDSLPFPGRPAGTESMPEIEHIVVLMMENHSFDNYLGMLRRGDGFAFDASGRPTDWNPTGDGQRQHVFLMPNDCQLEGKPSQDWEASHVQYANGTNRGFVKSASGPVAMGYWDGTRLPFYYSLASTFPLGDRWFCSLLGQTFPNRRYLTAATSAGMVDDIVSQIPARPANGTIFDRLDQHGISWRDYYSPKSVPTVDVWYSDPARQSPGVVHVDGFFRDAAAGRLPAFCIVEPDYSDESEENPQDVALGEAFAAKVVDAVLHGPRWSSTLLVWTYDEHGGYYDHVPPPPALAPDSIKPLSPVQPGGEPAYDGFERYGFRVPAVVVSPFARRDHVSHVVHDHTSILAMVERKWNLPAMTFRDANAADLTDFLDLSRRHFAEPPDLATPAHPLPACVPGQPGAIPPPGSVTSN
jgi:phospholipase C